MTRVVHLDVEGTSEELYFLVGGFGCDELVLYGIRELAPATLSTNESGPGCFTLRLFQDNKDETFPIRTEEGSKIELEFVDFQIEHHSTCAYDYVEGKGWRSE